MEKKLTNMDYLNSTCDNDHAMIRSICDMFLATTPPQITTLDNQVANESWDEVRKSAHKLKSSLRMFGAKDTADKLEYIEMNASTSPGEISKLISEIKSEIDQVCRELKP